MKHALCISAHLLAAEAVARRETRTQTAHTTKSAVKDGWATSASTHFEGGFAAQLAPLVA